MSVHTSYHRYNGSKIGLFLVLSTFLVLQRRHSNQLKRNVCAHAKNEEKGPRRHRARTMKEDQSLSASSAWGIVGCVSFAVVASCPG